MAGLKISICFWHLDQQLVDDVLLSLKKGKVEVTSFHCKDSSAMRDILIDNPPDLVISDFDLSADLNQTIEEEIGPFFTEVPMIYLVGEKNERKAAESLKLGVWDYVLKSHLYKLVPSVYSSQKFAAVIKQRQKTEQSLLESQEHFRALAENSPDVIMRFDRNYRHIYVNKAVELPTRLQISDFINRSHREMGIFPEEHVSQWEEALETVFKTGKPNTFLFDLEMGDRHFAFEWRLYPEIDYTKAINSVMAVARDISDSRKSHDALRQSEERLNQVLAATHLYLWDWNLATNELDFPSNWWSMLGYEPDELEMNLDTWNSAGCIPMIGSKILKLFQESVKNGEDTFELEFRLKHKNGSYVWIRSIGKAVAFDEKGNTTRLAGIHENIDERKRAEHGKAGSV